MTKIDYGAFRIAFHCAEGFYNLALPYIRKVNTPINSPESSKISPSEIIASATNLALALELYLKSLQIFTGMSPGSTHQLWSLLKNINSDVKSDVERRFDIERQTADPALGKVTGFSISRDPNVTIPVGIRAKKEDLKSVLIRAQDAFVTWRYIYEHAKPRQDAQINLEFEHSLMRFACHAVRDYIRENDPNNKS